MADFWASQLETFPVLAVEAVGGLIAMAYFFKNGFSTCSYQDKISKSTWPQSGHANC